MTEKLDPEKLKEATMDTKWTPGPWASKFTGTIEYRNIVTEDRSIPSQLRVVAHGVKQRNADLVSAAPEMYEALLRWCKICALTNSSPCETCNTGIALKKADGE